MHRFVRVKLGIVADIHGNDVALRAVLKDAERSGWTAGGHLATLSCSARGLLMCWSFC